MPVDAPDLIAIARCVRKRRFASDGDAVGAINKMLRSPRYTDYERLCSYFCGVCAGWHVGNRREATR